MSPSNCPRSTLPVEVLAWLARRLAHLTPQRRPASYSAILQDQRPGGSQTVCGMDQDLTRRLHTWSDGCTQAWNSNHPAAIGALFTHDAASSTAPYRPPWQGRDEIVRRWLERKDGPGETEFRSPEGAG